jgi:hypothetical protein
MRSSDISEQEAGKFLIRYAAVIDGWQQRFEQGPPRAQPGSAMIGDDRVSDPYQFSHAAWMALSHAADNLHAFRVATVTGSGSNYGITTRPYGAYANLRAALENSATALYLLGPADRNERITRRFRLWVQDGRHMDKLAKVLRSRPPAANTETRLTDLTSLIESRGLDPATITRPLSYVSIVRDAAPVAGADPDSGEAMWRILSGMTHGDTWASLNITEREHLSQELSDKAINLRLTSPVDRLAGFCAVVGTYLAPAFGIYDQRCLGLGG